MSSSDTPPRPLTEKRYARLLSDVAALMHEADDAATSERVSAFWHVGQRIEKERLTHKLRYHNNIIKDLARDTGIGTRNLQRAALFVEIYPEGPPEPDGLSWTHHRALCGVRSASEREALRLHAIENSLSAAELESVVRHGLPADAPTHLERPADPRYVFKARVLAIVDGDTIDVEADLGFQIKRDLRVRLAAINAPALTEPGGRKAKRFLEKSLLAAVTVTIKTERVDLHGRYVAHVFHASSELDYFTCFERGAYLNDQLLTAKLVRRATR